MKRKDVDTDELVGIAIGFALLFGAVVWLAVHS